MYRCESCGYMGENSDLGLCPECGRNSLRVILCCPECGKDLGKGSKDEINRIGWVCPKCNIKIYKEIYNDNK